MPKQLQPAAISELSAIANSRSIDAAAEAGVILRPHLFELLSGSSRVVSVAAPAGSGKTVLLRSWMLHHGLTEAAAWVTLGRDEQDPQRLWMSILDAFRQTEVGRKLVQPLSPAPDLDGEMIAERLLHDLSPLADDLWLILDDLHELRSEEARRQLEVFLMRSPQRLRFVLSSRRDVRIGMHRLRLSGQLTEIRSSELRFSLQETMSLLNGVDVRLSDTALQLLDDRTEGWAAGIRLAALSLGGHPNPDQFALEFSGSERTVAEYLLTEVLDRQPERVRRLLLRTAVLDRVNGSLADYLTGNSDSERVLHELEEAQAFVVSVDPERTWFRYHHLFAELLKLELRRTAPAEVRPLHAAAGLWFAERGQWLDAIRHMQEAEEWDRAAELLFDQWRSLQLAGQAKVASALLSRFPASLFERSPELAVLTADELVARGASDQAERYLAIATESSAPGREEAGRLQTEIAMVRLSIARHRGNLPAAIRQAQPLLSRSIDSETGARPISEEYRALALLNLGVAELWTAHHQDAERHLEQGIALARLADRPFLELRGLAHAAFLNGATSFEQAIARSREAISLARAHGWQDEPAAAVADGVLAGALVWRGRLDEALDPLERAERNLRPTSDPGAAVQVHSARGRLELARGRYQEAATALRRADRLGGAFVSRHMLARQARALFLQALLNLGEIERVDRALAELEPVERESSEMRNAHAALRLAQNDPEDATRLLAPVLEGSVPLVNRLWRLEPLILDAIARDALGDTVAAQSDFDRALDLAEQNGVVWPFLIHGTRALLEKQVSFQTTHASLISEILNIASGRSATSISSETEPLLEPLSASEMRVLRYLPTNLSAPEIAGDLSISVNTVKTHLRHVYAKLGTHRRAEAVQRARALGLLAPSTRSERGGAA
jgi:LuxR family transcriptional regulator, maltose regulon positive regulatory protein